MSGEWRGRIYRRGAKVAEGRGGRDFRLEIGEAGWVWWSGGMKKRREIQAMKERLAGLEAHLRGLEEQLQFLRDAHFQRDRLLQDMWTRSVETLHVTWEALRAVIPDLQSHYTGGNPARAGGRSHSVGPDKDAGGGE